MVAVNFFTRLKESLTIQDILQITHSSTQLEASLLQQTINNVAASRIADAQCLTFFNNKKYLEDLKATKAKFCLTTKNFVQFIPDYITAIIVDNPVFACIDLILALFDPRRQVSHQLQLVDHYYLGQHSQIGQNCYIMPGVVIGDEVTIGDNCVIESGVQIGNHCKIGSNCHIESNANLAYTEIGDGVIIHSGVCIGQDGYGFLPDPKGGILKVPQMDYVKIGNQVEIGANTCIDRGFVNPTVIGDLTKLDNLVHIAHGVTIGMGCFITAAVCIAGSTQVGNFVQIGGNSSIAGHIVIEDLVQIAGNSGVTKGIAKGTTVAGYPAVEINMWRKTFAFINRLVKKNCGKSTTTAE